MTECALYRMRDATGALLYVGIAVAPLTRMTQHKCDKDWWRDVSTIEIEWHESRFAALMAEREAIKCEAPALNVIHGYRRPNVNPDATSGAAHITSPTVDEIAEAWGVSLSDVALMMRVTRQALAKWRRRGIPAARALDYGRLVNVTWSVSAAAGVEEFPAVARTQMFDDGSSLLDIARSGNMGMLVSYTEHAGWPVLEWGALKIEHTRRAAA